MAVGIFKLLRSQIRALWGFGAIVTTPHIPKQLDLHVFAEHEIGLHQAPYLCKVSVEVRSTPFTRVSWIMKPDSCIKYRINRLTRVENLKLSAGYAAFNNLSNSSHQLINVGLNTSLAPCGDSLTF